MLTRMPRLPCFVMRVKCWAVVYFAAYRINDANREKEIRARSLLICSGEDNNCPFILLNLIFPHFSNFLSTRTRAKGKTKGSSLGVAPYDQAKSALVHLYRMSKYDIPSDFADNLKIFMKGLKRTVAAKKMEDGDSGIIGKKRWTLKCSKRYASCS
jgi:hypothetical protein